MTEYSTSALIGAFAARKPRVRKFADIALLPSCDQRPEGYDPMEPFKPTNQPTTVAEKVDHAAKLKDEIADLTKRFDETIESLGPLEAGTYEGHEHLMTVKIVPRTTLDQDAVRERLGSEWCEGHSKTTTSPRKTFSRRVPASR